MLILSRRLGESFILKLDESIDPNTPVAQVFNESIEVEFLEWKGRQVSLSIHAPASIQILRSELEGG